MTTVETKKPIPLPTIVRLYRRLRDRSQGERLRWGLWLERNPAVLARWVAESIETFSEFDNQGELFCSHAPPKTVTTIAKGNQLMRALATGGASPGTWRIPYGKQTIKLSFVDYEVPPAASVKVVYEAERVILA